MTKVQFPINLYSSIAGNSQHDLFPLNQLGLATLQTEYKNNVLSFNDITDYNLFTVNTARAVVAYGGEVLNYPVFLQVTQAVLSADVPVNISNRTTSTEDLSGNTVVTTKTWDNWTSVSKRNVPDSTDVAFPLHQTGKDYIPASEWATLTGEGYTILSEQEYRALAPQSDDA